MLECRRESQAERRHKALCGPWSLPLKSSGKLNFCLEALGKARDQKSAWCQPEATPPGADAQGFPRKGCEWKETGRRALHLVAELEGQTGEVGVGVKLTYVCQKMVALGGVWVTHILQVPKLLATCFQNPILLAQDSESKECCSGQSVQIPVPGAWGLAKSDSATKVL